VHIQEVDAQASSAEDPPPDSKAVMVLYGTEYGFSKEIAEKLAEKLRDSSGFWCVEIPAVHGVKICRLLS
jgi:sulfite reductase alpha subunit-like flavoprotein